MKKRWKNLTPPKKKVEEIEKAKTTIEPKKNMLLKPNKRMGKRRYYF